MKTNKISVALMLVLALLLACAVPAPARRARAAADTVLYFTDPECQVGDTVEVKMWVEPAVSGIDVSLCYDPEALTYVSCTGGAGNLQVQASEGYLRIFDYASSGTVALTYQLRFRANTVGTTAITVNGTPEITDADAEMMNVIHIGSSAVTVKEQPSLSSEAFLTSLNFQPGTLTPAFDPHVFTYDLEVASYTPSFVFSLKVSEGARFEYNSYLKNLPGGDMAFKIWVYAEDGVTRTTYTVNIHNPLPPTEPPTPPPTQRISGWKVLTILVQPQAR